MMPRKSVAVNLVLFAALLSSALACYPGNPSASTCPSQCKACYTVYVCTKGAWRSVGLLCFGWVCRWSVGCGEQDQATSGERGGRPTPSHREAASHPRARQQQVPAAPDSYSAPARAMREPTLNTAYPFTKESGVVPRVSRVERGRGCAEGACACVLEGERRGRIRNTP